MNSTISSIQTFESFIQLPGLRLPIRCTWVQDEKASILISPIPFSESDLKKLRSAGVTDIVAPSLAHHLNVGPAALVFPKATLWATPGLEKKRSDLTWKPLIQSDWPHSHFLETLQIEGAPGLGEVVFFHPKTKTLIVTDLLFHLNRPQGVLAPLLLRFLGNYEGFAVSRYLHFLVRDRVAFQNSVGKLFRWDFDRVIVGHGAPVEKEAKDRVFRAFKKRGYTPNLETAL